MTIETFLRRLAEGKSLSHAYKRLGHEGLISCWLHEGELVLTWEECQEGRQYDEHLYTRDQRVVFAHADELVAFLRTNGIDPCAFTP